MLEHVLFAQVDSVFNRAIFPNIQNIMDKQHLRKAMVRKELLIQATFPILMLHGPI